jgi:competence protein ComFC
MGILDLIFPKYCVNCKKYGDFLCVNCFSRLSFDTKNICLLCGKPSYDGLTHPICYRKNGIEGSFTGIVFNSISRKLIYQFKYKPFLSGLAAFLGDLLYESLIQNEEFEGVVEKYDVILVPVPLNVNKLRKRGYNQAGVLAKELGKKLNMPVLDCLVRIKDTKTQVGLSKKERQENIKDAFQVRDKMVEKVKNKNILIIDDVLTTGATFSEITRILKDAKVNKVWGVALARE